MTPIKQLDELRGQFLKQINEVFKGNVKSIEFEPFENDYEFEPYSLDQYGNLVTIDEFGNESDGTLKNLSIELIALLLTQIQLKNYSILSYKRK